jgi:hypothetical protein
MSKYHRRAKVKCASCGDVITGAESKRSCICGPCLIEIAENEPTGQVMAGLDLACRQALELAGGIEADPDGKTYIRYGEQNEQGTLRIHVSYCAAGEDPPGPVWPRTN